MKAGDWVQATKKQVEEWDEGGAWCHAEVNGVGHVVEMTTETLAFVYFERTGTLTLVDVDELRVLCNAEGNK